MVASSIENKQDSTHQSSAFAKLDCQMTTHPAELKHYAMSGLRPKPQSIKGIVYPKNTGEVSTILRSANQMKIPVYPISRGKNWGYGRATPVTENCVVLDLSKMDNIIEIDKDMAMAEIEPGVTQGALCSALQDTGLMMDVTGAGEDTSIVGNILERGFGHTPLGFRSQHFVITEMVLADGTVVSLNNQNSVSRFGRVGLASSLHELMQQSNFAIVTKLRVMLMPRPECSLKCIFTLNDENKLGDYIETVRQLKNEGVFDGLPHIGNDMRIISLVCQFDFEHWDPNQGIDDNQLARLRAKYKVAKWTLACGIYGTRSIAKAKANRAKQLLGKLGKIRIIDDAMIAKGRIGYQLVQALLAMVIPERLSALMEQMTEQSQLLQLMDGYPTGYARKGCYWRNRHQQYRPNTDPVSDGCGFRWIAPTLPLKGAEVMRMLTLARQHYRESGFEFAVTLTAINTRLCQAILTIYFDMDNLHEVQRAQALATRLKQVFDDNGWLAYRIAIDEHATDFESYPESLQDLRLRLKRAFDPNNIIAPGRYCTESI
ncbi:MAG: FAD-binding oxidoreductase [Gammaproteobacteria bacterium]|nr:FAD-binding oxidoreductase [Gammaproteobacteria bacterium]